MTTRDAGSWPPGCSWPPSSRWPWCPGTPGPYGLLVAFEIVQLAALAQAWSLMAGYGGIVSLAVAAFVGVGSYGTAEIARTPAGA